MAGQKDNMKPYYETERGKLYHGDCLEVMKGLQAGSVDLVLTDPPYGTTACRWDIVIPFQEMWKKIKDISKAAAPSVLFGAEPFSSMLRISNLKEFKYDWVWQKDKATNHLNAKHQPMRRNEIISVFYSERCTYFPQLSRKKPRDIRPETKKRGQAEAYGAMLNKSTRGIPVSMSYPNETLKFRACFGDKGKSCHPTQKPVPLMEYLIRTYTNEGETVLDFTMGSGTTGVACENLRRNFIGIELDEEYCEIAANRIRKATEQLDLFEDTK